MMIPLDKSFKRRNMMEFVQVWKWSKLVYKTGKYKRECDQEQERSTVTLINKLVEPCNQVKNIEAPFKSLKTYILPDPYHEMILQKW